MGTNYYLISNACPHCGHGPYQRHIGKSSAGWCFALHVYPEDDIHDLEDWLPLLHKEDSGIVDEYGEEYTPKEMLAEIRERSRIDRTDKTPYGNDSVPGPNGLARRRLGYWCLKHGEGTWDCVAGDFS